MSNKKIHFGRKENCDLSFVSPFSFNLFVFVMGCVFFFSCVLVLAACQLDPIFDEQSKSVLFDRALQGLQSSSNVSAETLALLGMASRSEDLFFFPEATLAFLRRFGRGLVESCDDAGKSEEKKKKKKVLNSYVFDSESSDSSGGCDCG